jgi:hypothetical protein
MHQPILLLGFPAAVWAGETPDPLKLWILLANTGGGFNRIWRVPERRTIPLGAK